MHGGKRCGECHLADPPKLLEENYEAWELFEAVSSQLRTSFGGIVGLDYTAVKIVADAFELKLDEILLRKIKVLEMALVDLTVKQVDKMMKKNGK